MKELFERYPQLKVCEKDIEAATDALSKCFQNGGKLLLCGNGGSCADCDHIVGELMKGFLKKRSFSDAKKAELRKNCPELDEESLSLLQGGLPAVSLSAIPALNTAFMNDVEPSLIYAQALAALVKDGDILLAISTSGNSKNVLNAARLARGLGIKTLALTGECGGALKELADICIAVPETETYKVQELHLPVYHAICAEIEARFFKE